MDTAPIVPSGIERPGSARSPERLAPSIIPTTAGKTKEKTCGRSHSVPRVECSPGSHWPEPTGAYANVSPRPYRPLPPLAPPRWHHSGAAPAGVGGHSADHAHGRYDAVTLTRSTQDPSASHEPASGVKASDERLAATTCDEPESHTEPIATMSATTSPAKMK